MTLIRKISKKIIYPFVTRPKNESWKEILWCREYFDVYKRFKKNYTNDELELTLNKGCDVLNKLNVKYWIGRGTLLGFYRNGEFLPKDNDIDIDVFTDKDVYKIIHELPFEIYCTTILDGRYHKVQCFDDETKILFDLWFYHLSENRIINRDLCGRFSLPSTIPDNLTTFNYKGRSFPVPDPEWYMNYWYGKNWKNPISYEELGHWSNTYERDCSGFEKTTWDHQKTIFYY